MTLTRKFFITALAMVFILGIGGYAMAGRGGCPMQKKGSGFYAEKNLGFEECKGPGGKWDNITPEQKEKLKAEREVFKKDTEDLRIEIMQRQLDLQKELLNKTPSVRKAKSIQKDISGLEAKFAQEKIVHLIRMKEICPELGKKIARCLGIGHHGPKSGKGFGKCRF